MRIVLSIGLKGGVGKTTIAAGMARALQRCGYRVGVLDLDYRTPNIPLALDGGVATLNHTYDGDILIPADIDGLKVMSMAYIWPDWKCVLVEDAEAMEDVVHLMTPGIIEWGELDYLIIDTPPTSVGVCRVALETEDVQGAMIITHSSTFSRMDTIRTLDLFAEKGVPVIGVVCNQSIDFAGILRYDLTPFDIQKVADDYSIPSFYNLPHSLNPLDLQQHFDKIAKIVINTVPVILTIKEPSENAWTKLQQLTRKLGNGNS